MPLSNAQDSRTAPTVVVERVRLRTLFHRRGKLVKAMFWFLPITGLIIYLSLLQRDDQAQRTTRIQAEIIARAFQHEFATQRKLPVGIPQLPPPDNEIADRFFFNYFYASAARNPNRVGVCCQRVPLRLFLESDGRYLILFDGQTFSAEWMNEADFQQQAASLGLPATVSP